MTFTTLLFAQTPCVPGTLSLPQAGYIIPDSATNFANGCAGQYYEQIIYIKAPNDTSITYLGSPVSAHVDSFVINSTITGLPSGLIVESVPALTLLPTSRLIVPGNTMACIKISGIMPATATGTINLTMAVRAYLHVLSIIPIDTAANVNYYHINITPAPCSPSSVQLLNKYSFNIIGAVPNPADYISKIQFESKNEKTYTMKLSNAVGEVVLTNVINAKSGINTIPIDVSNVANGLYMYSLSDGQNILSDKLQVAK